MAAAGEKPTVRRFLRLDLIFADGVEGIRVLGESTHVADSADGHVPDRQAAGAGARSLEDVAYGPPFICHVSGGMVFDTLEEFKEHRKSDWYRYNVQRRGKGLSSIPEDEFERMVDNGEDLGDISGSDESDDEDQGVRQVGGPTIRVRLASDEIAELFRSVVSADRAVTLDTVRQGISDLLSKHWLVLLCRGGHFAAAVYALKPQKKGPAQLATLAHKTFHRYVTRRKAGGRQSTADGSKSIKSAGSSIRRYNESMLVRDIADCLVSWKADWIDTASHVFVSIPGPANKAAVFSKLNTALESTDPRIRSIPFITNRPTLAETARAAERLLSARVLSAEELQAIAAAAEQKSTPPANTRTEAPAAECPSTAEPSEAAVDDELPVANDEGPEPPAELHEAASVGDADAVGALLAGGADPTVRHPRFRHKLA